jgi:hypothetical protein
MTLQDLFDAAAPHLAPGRVKDLKTSIRYLARALGRDDPAQCGEADYLQPLPALKDRLDQLFAAQPVSPHTVRNTRNNLSRLFRQAEALDLIHPRPPLPRRQSRRALFQEAKRARVAAPTPTTPRPYRLPLPQWPAPIQQGWATYVERKRLQLRPVSVQTTQSLLESYLGFFAHMRPPALRSWEDLFAIPHLEAFVHWHADCLQVRVTQRAVHLAHRLRAIARALKLPQAAALGEYCQSLPLPEPRHDKRHHWISLHELEQVGLALLEEARQPVIGYAPTQHRGLQRALACQHALMLRLLVRVPLRQRNLRELQLERHLYRDAQQRWTLEFKGADLKIGTKNGRLNVFRVPFPVDLVSHLEEFLARYRPLLPQAAASPSLFLTQRGRPYARYALYNELAVPVWQRTGKRFYPHLIRTIWATEFISREHDFATAAYMLNDRVETVLKRYHELFDVQHQQRATAFLQATLARPTAVEAGIPLSPAAPPAHSSQQTPPGRSPKLPRSPASGGPAARAQSRRSAPSRARSR